MSRTSRRLPRRGPPRGRQCCRRAPKMRQTTAATRRRCCHRTPPPRGRHRRKRRRSGRSPCRRDHPESVASRLGPSQYWCSGLGGAIPSHAPCRRRLPTKHCRRSTPAHAPPSRAPPACAGWDCAASRRRSGPCTPTDRPWHPWSRSRRAWHLPTTPPTGCFPWPGGTTAPSPAGPSCRDARPPSSTHAPGRRQSRSPAGCRPDSMRRK
mmetsp:Transcript_30528/g.76993  ORF Transcript_30528/g.76993 Transcript_30528/m.76993 type:complete len:209 (-) Transcript_30528:965-1591(-)